MRDKKWVGIIFLLMVILASIIIIQTKKVKNYSKDTINVQINANKPTKKISQYIYGVNQGADLNKVTTASAREGGNRRSTYNWENNYSNAGSDWQNYSDTYLTSSTIPGADTLEFVAEANNHNIGYKVATLQMMGYVAADKNGKVTESEKVPSARWNKVEFRKNGALSLTPNLTDGVVYMDEYMNYLINKLGDSTTSTGIQGYSLDNEPALWSSTHSLVHPEKTTMTELIEKSVELAKVVKDMDSNADVFGPALFGTVAYSRLSLDKGTEEYEKWEKIKKDNGYKWFVDYYLDEMNKASKVDGRRLLDYFDIHYYSEVCDTPEKMLQASRTLYDENYIEDSYVGEWFSDELPYLPKIQESIKKYFPGTKLAITEYSLRGKGNTVYEGIAEIQYLAAFAKNDVAFASTGYSKESDYLYSAINMYTDCGNDGNVGENLVDTTCDDISQVCTFAATDTSNAKNAEKLNIILTNNNIGNSKNITIKIKKSNKKYSKAKIYGITLDSSEILEIDASELKKIENNKFMITMPAVSAYRIVLE